MKVDFSKKITNFLTGEPILVPTEKEDKTKKKVVYVSVEGNPLPVEREVFEKIQEPLTLRDVAINSLLNQYEDEKNLEAKEKLDRYRLAEKIRDSKKAADIELEDVTKIKGLIAKSYSTSVYGQCVKLLEEGAA